MGLKKTKRETRKKYRKSLKNKKVKRTLKRGRLHKKGNKKGKKDKKSKKRFSKRQKGGFVTPFFPEFKNLYRSIPYKMSETHHILNPQPYPGPSNPTKGDINPHPAYDQYLRGHGDMLDPDVILGPNLADDFDESIKQTRTF